jgi:hypothetical protein
MDEKYDINKDPDVRGAMEKLEIPQGKATTSIVPLDEERRRRKRGGPTRGKRAVGSDGIHWPDVTEHGGPKKTCANARLAI